MKDRFTTEEAREMLERVRATEIDDISNLDQQLKSGKISESDYTVARKGALDKATKLREAVKNKVDTKYTELQKTGKTTIKGVTDKIDSNIPRPINYDSGLIKPENLKAASIGVDDVADKAKRLALKTLGKKAMAAIPVLGGVYSAMDSGDVMAAIPGLDTENLGPQKGTKEYGLESGISDDETRTKMAKEGLSILKQQSDEGLRRKQLEKLAGR